jgi:hypothetical protein
MLKDAMLKSNLLKNKFHYMLETPKALSILISKTLKIG